MLSFLICLELAYLVSSFKLICILLQLLLFYSYVCTLVKYTGHVLYPKGLTQPRKDLQNENKLNEMKWNGHAKPRYLLYLILGISFRIYN